jgi:hypothetical protein
MKKSKKHFTVRFTHKDKYVEEFPVYCFERAIENYIEDMKKVYLPKVQEEIEVKIIPLT